MYTEASLIAGNYLYHTYHTINKSDVEHANQAVAFIETTRKDSPMPGDVVEYTDVGGEYMPNGRIEKYVSQDSLYLNKGGGTPWVQTPMNDMSLSMSGGPWGHVNPHDLEWIGVQRRPFKMTGSVGLCKDCGVYFSAHVNVWEYIAPDSYFPPEYTTRDWDRKYVHCHPDGERTSWLSGSRWANEHEYLLWLRAYRGVGFDCLAENTKSVFYYREDMRLVDREFWNSLDLPLDTRWLNGIVLVKVAYDDALHSITTYRFTNDGSTLALAKYEAYEREKGTDLTPFLSIV